MNHRTLLLCGGAVSGLVAALLPTAGCEIEPVQLPEGDGEHIRNQDVIAQDPEATVGGEDDTFDHADDLGAMGGKTDAQIWAQRLEEGPPPVRTRMHSCTRLPVETLRRVLEDFGVNINLIAAPGQPKTAGEIYLDGLSSLGVPQYDARISTPLVASAAGSVKVQDIWTQAAAEIIVAMGALPHCMVGGQGVAVFDANDRCNREAITCLIGRPATDDHLWLCDQAVETAGGVEKGKIIAVASLLAAAHTCE